MSVKPDSGAGTQSMGCKDRGESWLAQLVCPQCDSSLHVGKLAHQRKLVCSSCDSAYPVIEVGLFAIPWLQSKPEQIRQEWHARMARLQRIIQTDIRNAQVTINDSAVSALTRQRMQFWQHARGCFLRQVTEILQPLSLHSNIDHFNFDTAVAREQDIVSYIDNIFRDWAWSNGENEQLLEFVEDLLHPLGWKTELGEVLTLGAGAGRLSFDLHQLYQCRHSVISDINPLLLTVAAQMLSGNELNLYEFPVAPVSMDKVAVLQSCSTAKIADSSIQLLFADVLETPFKSNSFQMVLTPWLIDVLPMTFDELCKRVNRVLKKGGAWINAGSLNYMNSNQRWNYTQEEIAACLEYYGFEIVRFNREFVPYLCSPASAHWRQESLFGFCALKKDSTHTPQKLTLTPSYITNQTDHIPKNEHYTLQSAQKLFESQVLAAIDGDKSVEQIAQQLTQRYQLELEHARFAVQCILDQNRPPC